MNNLNTVRGVFLMAVALLFGVGATQYQIGQFGRAGPGLFPLFVASMLFIIGLITVVRARFVEPVPLDLKYKNITIILLSLIGFALISRHLNMLAGIVFLVFFATAAGDSYSVMRNVKIAAGLIAVAFLFKNLLGLNLPLL